MIKTSSWAAANPTAYNALADLLDYPSETYPDRVVAVIEILKQDHPEASQEICDFQAKILAHDFAQTCSEIEKKDPKVGCGWNRSSMEQVRALYLGAFDLQAITTLDVGYVLFGDDYKRGALLASLNREQHLGGQAEGVELADHLPRLLRWLPTIKTYELTCDLAGELLMPALSIMIGEFSPARLALKTTAYLKQYKTLIEPGLERAAVFIHPLQACRLVLSRDFPDMIPGSVKDHN